VPWCCRKSHSIDANKNKKNKSIIALLNEGEKRREPRKTNHRLAFANRETAFATRGGDGACRDKH